MPKRGAKSASAKIRERIEFLDDEEWVDTENDFFLKIVKLVKIFEYFRAPDMIKSCEQTGVNSFFLCRTCYGICCFWL